ncbi:GFA family protein [Sphingopyxis sp. PET50]|uniref:GFA family protein n=1 Tax=Sphingopyxis sp. PET50 TaxID=2976533 RepID=UPI0021B02DBA|nr:GFA family protein [Sphingopyxis sp. PET50]
MTRSASCHCGQLALTCSGEPTKVSLCHCYDCQRRTGSLFSVAAFFPRSQMVQTSGTAKAYRRQSASGHAVSFHFCTECGSSLWWEPDRMPHLVGVAVGSFADRNFPKPEQAVWTDDQHPWLRFPDDLPAHSRNPVKPTKNK